MKGDFSRDTFDATKHFLRVLMQQGRVQLDADWNEQVAILLHYIQRLAADIIGPHGGPVIGPDGKPVNGFKIEPRTGVQLDFIIQPGYYYVDGILCENDAEQPVPYTDQPDYPLPASEELQNGKNYVVYLDVWERHITHIEDFKFPFIHEIALGGKDTTTRARVVWQVKTEVTGVNSWYGFNWFVLIDKWQPNNRGMIKAKGKEAAKKVITPCTISPEARYRGAENQLYRVEIHKSGTAAAGATFKWSRDNGSVVFPILKIEGNAITLEHLGQDNRRTLEVGNWVEIIDDAYALQDPMRGQERALLQVEAIDSVEKIIKLTEGVVLPPYDNTKHPYLRRWEGKDIVIIEEKDNDPQWFDLEDGIRIQFQRGNHKYRSNDYWLIPARTATGDILWPTEKDNAGNEQPSALRPLGVKHHYAPLWIITVDANGNVSADDSNDGRRMFKSIPELSVGGLMGTTGLTSEKASIKEAVSAPSKPRSKSKTSGHGK